MTSVYQRIKEGHSNTGTQGRKPCDNEAEIGMMPLQAKIDQRLLGDAEEANKILP